MGFYTFYVKMDENVFGPYTIDEIRNLGLLEDTEVMEASLGCWYPANYYDFDALYAKEHSFHIDDEGQIHRPEKGNNPDTSGNPYLCPERAKGWSWGAFFFSWIWGLCNGVYWPLIMIPLCFIPIIGQVINLILQIILGINGREMAWNSGHWRRDDVEAFNRKQASWSSAAGTLLVIGVIGTVISIFILLGN